MTITIISDHETTEAITRHLRRVFVVVAEIDKPDSAGIWRRLTVKVAEKEGDYGQV